MLAAAGGRGLCYRRFSRRTLRSQQVCHRKHDISNSFQRLYYYDNNTCISKETRSNKPLITYVKSVSQLFQTFALKTINGLFIISCFVCVEMADLQAQSMPRFHFVSLYIAYFLYLCVPPLYNRV